MSRPYYASVRTEVLPLWPRPGARVLEIGCGAGATLGHLKAAGLCSWAAGVEMVGEQAEAARAVADEVVAGDVERLDLPFAPGSFDVLLCLDVLEHLRDPWAAVRRLRGYLAPGGVAIASLPNVRHFGVSLRLLLLGRWDYAAEGILDRTHLRFFVRRTAVELFEGGGFTVDRVVRRGLDWPSRRAVANALTLGLLRDLLTSQFLLRAARRE